MPMLTRYLRLRSAHRDRAVINHLRAHPGAEATTIALALHHPRNATQRRLRRLEEQGRVTSRWECDDAFYYHAYYATEEHP